MNLHNIYHFTNTDLTLVSAPEPSPQPETYKKKDVIEILSHKKAYNACKYKWHIIVCGHRQYTLYVLKLN